MPVAVRKGKTPNCRWEIYETETGKRVGCSLTKRNAEASARARNAAFREKQERQQRQRRSTR